MYHSQSDTTAMTTCKGLPVHGEGLVEICLNFAQKTKLQRATGFHYAHLRTTIFKKL